MAIHTLTFPVEHEPEVKQTLVDKGFTLHPLQHGYWLASHHHITVSLYKSGRMVIQGSEPHIATLLDLLQTWMEKGISQLGFDECGKGDVFGPLILAGVGVKASQYPQLRMVGISESKKASPSQLQHWYEQILTLCHVETLVWNPIHYNELYARYKNINTLLTMGYKTLLERFSSGWDEVIIDAYALDMTTQTLLTSSSPAPLTLKTKGERFLAVGAASIVARKLFLEWFEHQPYSFPRGANEEAKKLFFQLREEKPHELPHYAKINFFSR